MLLANCSAALRRQICSMQWAEDLPFLRQHAKPKLSTRSRCRLPWLHDDFTRCLTAQRAALPSLTMMCSLYFRRPA